MALKLKTSGSNHAHALLSPSAAKKWLGCPAALACEFGIPNESGAAAVLGTAMHTISEVHLNRYIEGTARALVADTGCYVRDSGKGGIVARSKAPKDGVLITDDMIGQVTKYTDYCKPIIDAADFVKLEMRVELTQILHPGYIAPDADINLKGSVETFGTADLVALLPRAAEGEHMLIIGDLKTGRHRVEAKENKQLMLYALGVLRRLRRRHNITLVRLVIFQPYAGGEAEWDITPEALNIFGKFAADRAVLALDAFYKGKKNLKAADFKASADACQWCRFAEKCNAKAKSATHQLASDSDLSDSAEMSPEELKAAWDKLPELRQHIATIEKAVYSALHKGVKVPGLKLVEGRPGNRAWAENTDDVQLIAALVQTGTERREARGMVYENVLLSPAKMEKVVPKEAWETMTLLTVRKTGAPSIAAADDNRPEWNAASNEDLA